jgi:hypothetical protein
MISSSPLSYAKEIAGHMSVPRQIASMSREESGTGI